MENAFKYVSDKNDFIALIRHFNHSKKGIIWQSLQSSRLNYSIEKVTIVKDEIVLTSNDKIELKKTSPVYVFIDHRNLIFKIEAETFKCSDNSLITKIPSVAKCIEERKNPRFLFPSDSVRVTVKLIAKNRRVTEYATAHFFDISKSGFSIVWPLKQKFFFSKGDYFKIVKINERHTRIPALFKVAHVSYSIKTKFVRVGFGTDQPFLENFHPQVFGNF